MILLIKVPLFNQFIVGVDQVDNVVKHTKKKVTQPREEKVLHSRLKLNSQILSNLYL